jgi:hypothetical protein
MPPSVPSEVQICNMALAHLATGQQIQSLDDRSAEARVCKLFYAQVRDEVLNIFPWPFATKYASLALVGGTVDVPYNTDYQYAYAYPSDATTIRRIYNGISRIETHESRVPYTRSQTSTGAPLILTDFPPQAATDVLPALPYCEYTQQVTDPARYSPPFAQAVAFLMAFYMAPQLTAGDRFKLGQRALALYNDLLEQAQANAVDELQADQLPASEFILARDGNVQGFPNVPMVVRPY